MNIGSLVDGKDIKGNNITGKLENIINLANMGIVKTGEDRLDVAYCYLNLLKEK